MARTSSNIDFMERKTQECPHAAYGSINAAGGVYIDRSTGFYIVTNYDLIKRIAADNKDFLNQTGVLGVRNADRQSEIDKIHLEKGVPIRDVLVSDDPPNHILHRALVDKVFAPAKVAKMELYLREVVDHYIDRLIENHEADFQNDLAVMVPMTVIADQIGLPRTPKDIKQFRIWSDAYAFRSEPNVPHNRAVELAETVCELQRYIVEKVEVYKKSPANCMLSDLVHVEVNGQHLGIEDLVSIVMVIIAAGNETTTSAISNGLIRMISEPGLQARLRSNLALIPSFIEEVLRIDAPLQGLFRRTRTDVKLGDLEVPAGSIVVLRWGGANLDPKKFSEPETFDLDRENLRQHVTFGFGPHFCVGHQLARSELRCVFERILTRLQNLRFSDRPDAVVRAPHYITYGVRNLYIAFDKVVRV